MRAGSHVQSPFDRSLGSHMLDWGRLAEQVAAAEPSCECRLGSVHCLPSSTGVALHGYSMVLGVPCLTVRPLVGARSCQGWPWLCSLQHLTCDLCPAPHPAGTIVQCTAEGSCQRRPDLAPLPCRDLRAATTPR